MTATFLVALLASAPTLSPSEVGGTWSADSWVQAVRQGGYSPLKPGLHGAHESFLEFFQDGGALFLGDKMSGETFAPVVFSRRGRSEFVIVESGKEKGRWRWLAHDRAYISFDGPGQEYVRLRLGEDLDDIRNKYLFQMTEAHWAEVVGTYLAPDGGVLRVDADGGGTWGGHRLVGDLLECRNECRADAGIRLCFESAPGAVFGVADDPDSPIPVSFLFESDSDGGLSARRVHIECDGAAVKTVLESYRRQ